MFAISAIEIFQTKVYKIDSCYSVRKTKKGNVGYLRKFS